MRGKNGQAGVGVVEAFDLDQSAYSKLANISTRGFVEVDDNVMIAGLIAPSHDMDAALVQTLPPGAYTAVVRGNGQTTGVGLVEVYNIP